MAPVPCGCGGSATRCRPASLALAGLAALWAVALVLLHHQALPRSHVISVHDTVGVAQLVFLAAAAGPAGDRTPAGAGAVHARVALLCGPEEQVLVLHPGTLTRRELGVAGVE